MMRRNLFFAFSVILGLVLTSLSLADDTCPNRQIMTQ